MNPNTTLMIGNLRSEGSKSALAAVLPSAFVPARTCGSHSPDVRRVIVQGRFEPLHDPFELNRVRANDGVHAQLANAILQAPRAREGG